jgi:hypothetical protein
MFPGSTYTHVNVDLRHLSGSGSQGTARVRHPRPQLWPYLRTGTAHDDNVTNNSIEEIGNSILPRH